MEPVPYDKAFACRLLSDMLRIRRMEEKCAELYGAGKIRGFLHLYTGQEACAVGALNALREALCHEEEELSFYRNAAERTIDEKGAAMYAALAEEAEARLAIIQRQIAALEAGGAAVRLDTAGGTNGHE